MDVVFQEVIQFIGEGVDGAVDGFGDAVLKGEREGGLVAGGKRDKLQFSEIIGDLDVS